MNKIIIFLFIFIITYQAFPAESELISQKIQGSKELPLELNLLLESLQPTTEEGNINLEKILPYIKAIDFYSKFLSKEDIFLIAKIEIYKTLLKTNGQKTKANISGDSARAIELFLKRSNDPFAQWFFKAILEDTQNLLSSSLFKEYLLQKDNGQLEKIEFKKMEKKVQILYRWISKINIDSSEINETIKNELDPLLLECLKNIEQSFFLLAANHSKDALLPIPVNITKFKFFSLATVNKPKKISKKAKTVEDILSPITNESTVNDLPLATQEDWSNEENTPQNLKNLPKPTNDADWLQDF